LHRAFTCESGIIYCSPEEAYEKFEEIKRVLENGYEENGEPSNEFINTFAETYGLCLPNDIFFDASLLFELF